MSVLAIFFGSVSSGKGNKSKNKQMGLHQTKRFLCSKGNYQQNEKAVYGMGENICKPHVYYKVNTQYIQGTHATQ